MTIKELRQEIYELLMYINEYYSEEQDVSFTGVTSRIYDITDKC